MLGHTLQSAYGVLNRKARRARAARLRRRRPALFEPLEPRLLLSASPLNAAPAAALLDMPEATPAVWQEPLHAVDISLQALAAQGGDAAASPAGAGKIGRAHV